MAASKEPEKDRKRIGRKREKAKALLRRIAAKITGKRTESRPGAPRSARSPAPVKGDAAVSRSAPAKSVASSSADAVKSSDPRPAAASSSEIVPPAVVSAAVAPPVKVPAVTIPAAATVPGATVPGATVHPGTIPAAAARVERARFEPFREGRLVLLEIDPYRLFAYWDIDPRALAEARHRSGDEDSAEIIRFHEVSLVEFDGSNANETFDITVNGASGSYYLNLWSPGKTLVAEMGLIGVRGKFAAVTRSNTIALPPDSESSRFEIRRRRVAPVASSLWRPRRAVRIADSEYAASAAAAALSTASADEWGDEFGHDSSSASGSTGAGASRARSSGAGRTGSASADDDPLAADSLDARSDAAQGVVPVWRDAVGISSAEMLDDAASSASIPRDDGRPRIEIRADIVVYGRAMPGTEILIDGTPVPVKEDGTFDVRFALPPQRSPAREVVPATAPSPQEK